MSTAAKECGHSNQLRPNKMKNQWWLHCNLQVWLCTAQWTTSSSATTSATPDARRKQFDCNRGCFFVLLPGSYNMPKSQPPTAGLSDVAGCWAPSLLKTWLLQ